MRFLDYDNDGWKDLLMAQGHVLDTVELTYPQLRYREPMLLARNTGHGLWTSPPLPERCFRRPGAGPGNGHRRYR